MKVLEMFAGIGSQVQALKNLGIEVESTISEIDKFAIKSYMAIHGETPNLGDITKIEHIPQVDLLTYSFPCQDLSVAGFKTGMDEGSGTRSSLLWEVGRLLQDAKQRGALPHYLLMENVDAILNKKNIANFEKWMDELEALGYTNSYKVLNAKDFGVPQNRKRCFMVSALNGKKFIFPDGEPLTKCLKDVLDETVDESFYFSDEKIAHYEEHRIRQEENGRHFGWKPTHGEGIGSSVTTKADRQCSNFIIVSGNMHMNKYEMVNRVYSTDGISPTMRTFQGGGLVPKIKIEGDLNYYNHEQANRVYGTDGISPTVQAQIGGDTTPKIKESIKFPCNTKKGYMEAEDGDGLVMDRPTHARGTVQKQVTPTLNCGTGCGTGVVVKDNDYIPEMKDGEVCAMLTPGREKRQNGPRCKNDGTAFTVTCQDRHGVASNEHGKLRIRYLTPDECWRLMGFPDGAIDKARAIGISKTQLYKQAGNSIVVNVLEAIFKGMFIDNTWTTKFF